MPVSVRDDVLREFGIDPGTFEKPAPKKPQLASPESEMGRFQLSKERGQVMSGAGLLPEGLSATAASILGGYSALLLKPVLDSVNSGPRALRGGLPSALTVRDLGGERLKNPFHSKFAEISLGLPLHMVQKLSRQIPALKKAGLGDEDIAAVLGRIYSEIYRQVREKARPQRK